MASYMHRSRRCPTSLWVLTMRALSLDSDNTCWIDSAPVRCRQAGAEHPAEQDQLINHS